MMARIAVQTESNIDYVDTLSTGFAPKRSSITNAIGHAAASIAAVLGTSCIAPVTKSGFTARMVARFRPVCPLWLPPRTKGSGGSSTWFGAVFRCWIGKRFMKRRFTM